MPGARELSRGRVSRSALKPRRRRGGGRGGAKRARDKINNDNNNKKRSKLVKSPPFTDGYWNVVLAKVVLLDPRSETGGESNVSCA